MIDKLGLEQKILCVEGEETSRDYALFRLLCAGIPIDIKPSGGAQNLKNVAIAPNICSCRDRDYDLLTYDYNLESFFNNDLFWRVSDDKKTNHYRLKWTEIENVILLVMNEIEDFELEKKVLQSLDKLIYATALRISKTTKHAPVLTQLRKEKPYKLSCDKGIESLLKDAPSICFTEEIEHWRSELISTIDNDFDKAMILLDGNAIWTWLETCAKCKLKSMYQERIASKITEGLPSDKSNLYDNLRIKVQELFNAV
ncbi:MAG: hypothetical protein LBN32_02695 [Helicobacteraceae bacterium]|jgi:hypothetical protein|nr:hypothetical protein [Helicobacteraceae bacterium]